jgi:hemoglobin/transferrin/lactoferrin receptor protein
MKHGAKTWWLILNAQIIAALAASAAETNAVRLAELVVTPLRRAAPAAEVPYASQVVGGDELAALSPRTMPDALRELPSVMVQKTSYGQGSPYLRGFTGFRTLMMVDGVRLNNCVFRDGPNQYWSTVDLWSVDRYEAVMGPASVLYGSDAVGGAVNAITEAPPAWTGAAGYGGRIAYRGATADQSHQGRFEVNGRPVGDFGFVAGVTLKTFDDVRGGADVGDQPHTGYDETDFDLRGEYAVAPDTTLTLAHQQVNQDDAWRTHRTIYGIDWEGLARGDDQVHSFDQERTFTYLRLQSRDRVGAVDGYSLTLSRQAQGEDQDRVRADGRQDLQGFDVTTWGAVAELQSETDLGRLVYGVDYYRDVVDSYARHYAADGALAKTDVQGPVADDATYDLLGVFVQDTVATAGGALEVTPGVRYTRAALEADRVAGEPGHRDGYWDTVVGSLRALAPLGEGGRHSLYAGVSQGFRSPNLSDLTRLDTARSAEIETPVDDLEPEQFLSWELGGRYRGERLSADAAWFFTQLKDLIVRAPTGEVVDELLEVTKKNASEGFVQGLELALRYQLADDWSARLAASWMEGESDAYPTSDPVEATRPLSRVMPPTGHAALRWQPAGAVYWLEAALDAAGKADELSAEDERDTQRIPEGGTPGYAVGTLRGGTKLHDDLALTLALENVSDEDYRYHGSGVNEPGRQLVVSADYRF